MQKQIYLVWYATIVKETYDFFHNYFKFVYEHIH